jgi:anaphase-promoting complex subunit 8
VLVGLQLSVSVPSHQACPAPLSPLNCTDQSLPEAIQAHTRALLGADRVQTPTILSKLAALHTAQAQAQAHAQPDQGAGGYVFSQEAIDYHKKLIALGESEGTRVGEMAGSYLAVAEWEMSGSGSGSGSGAAIAESQGHGGGVVSGRGAGARGGRRPSGRGGRAGSGIGVGVGFGADRTGTDPDTGHSGTTGDWTLAAMYLEKVVASNAPQRDKAEELLRELRVMEARAVIS